MENFVAAVFLTLPTDDNIKIYRFTTTTCQRVFFKVPYNFLNFLHLSLEILQIAFKTLGSRCPNISNWYQLLTTANTFLIICRLSLVEGCQGFSGWLEGGGGGGGWLGRREDISRESESVARASPTRQHVCRAPSDGHTWLSPERSTQWH